MDNEDKNKFAVTIAALLETFGVQATKPIMHGYWMGLSDLALATLHGAVERAIRECDRLPKPAELRKLAGSAVDGETRATLAWIDVLRAVELGPYKHIDFDDKLCNAAIRALGGWPNFVSRFTDAAEEEFTRHAFTKAYRNLKASSLSLEACVHLSGLNEAVVIDGMLAAPVPVRIACSDDRAYSPRLECELQVQAIVDSAFV